MQGLHIQVVIGLHRYEAHRPSCDGLGDRLGIDVVALVRFHVRPHILRWYQPHFVSLFPQCPAKKMRTPQASMPISSTCMFAVKRSSCVRENFLRTTTSPRRLSPTRWKTVLPRSMPIVCSSMRRLLRKPPTHRLLIRKKRRTIPLTRPCRLAS